MSHEEQLELKREYLDKDMKSILGHSMIVSKLAYLVGKELDIPDKLCYELAVAGMVHDIGKIHLDSYLAKYQEEKEKITDIQSGMMAKNQLDTNEVHYVRMHSKFSYDILKEYDYSDIVLDTVLYHHENYDGTGYPEGLQGTDIPMGARILRVCDVFAALVCKRAYRDAFDADTAVAIMIDEIKNYDMRVFLAFQRVIHEQEAIRLFEMMQDYKKTFLKT